MSQGAQTVDLPAGIEPQLAELCRRSQCQKFGIPGERFVLILQEIAVKYLGPQAAPSELREMYSTLRVEELALARACAEGNERAWEVFMSRYREKLYDVAAYITKESSSARELADSIYADLYGTVVRGDKRVSKLASYTGRGSLEGWLRTVIAQEYVNRYRRQKRLVSLDEESEDGVQFAAAETEAAAPVDARLEAATGEALAALPAEDRYVLAAYYLDGRTLAEIARSLSVHESTISRKLDKLARALRKQIVASLARRGMDRRQAEEALEADVRDLRVNVRARLAQEPRAQTFPDKKAEAGAGEM